ncbi:MAG TPA: DUF6134 family protein [Planctomycetaceae bacterium]|nr:DUF6134 family protein [Planctomycetaceae bacterium]
MKAQRTGGIRRQAAWRILVILGCGWTTIAAAEPRDLERQTREFRVSVDGKERGKCVMQLSRRDDGTDRVRIDSQLRFNYVVYDYRYSSSGTETWKEGRLIQLENTADYNGTKYVVKAGPARKGLQVTVNGKASQNDADAWVTSYWHLPERLAPAGPVEGKKVVPAAGRRSEGGGEARVVPLLDSDKGRALRGKLQFVGEETISVAGHRKACKRYRVAGDVQVELWYDDAQRLVRQESVDEGHKTLLELVKLSEHP